MSTARFTLGSVLGSISSTATAVTTTIDAAAKGADLFSNFMDKQLKEQSLQHKVDFATMQERIIVNAAKDMADLEDTIRKQKTKSVDYSKSFDKHYEKFTALVEANES